MRRRAAPVTEPSLCLSSCSRRGAVARVLHTENSSSPNRIAAQLHRAARRSRPQPRHFEGRLPAGRSPSSPAQLGSVERQLGSSRSRFRPPPSGPRPQLRSRRPSPRQILTSPTHRPTELRPRASLGAFASLARRGARYVGGNSLPSGTELASTRNLLSLSVRASVQELRNTRRSVCRVVVCELAPKTLP